MEKNGASLRLRAHVYVFKKIRFGVSTRIIRQSKDPVHTDEDRSQETCLHLKITAFVFYMYVDRDGLALFCLFPFACQCHSSVLLHVLVARGRSVCSLQIMEAGDKRKAPEAKRNTIKRSTKQN